MSRTIGANSLFKEIEKVRKQSSCNKVQEIYCCMYELALIESQGKNLFKKVIDEEISLNKRTYEEILHGMEEYNKIFKRFLYKNVLISTVLFAVTFLTLKFALKVSLGLSIFISIIVFICDLYINGKTNDNRFSKKWLKKIESNVDHSLIKEINSYFS